MAPQYPNKLWYFWTWLKYFFMLIGMICFIIWLVWIFVDVLFLGGPR